MLYRKRDEVKTEAALPEWVRSWFLEGREPAPGSAEHDEYRRARFLSGGKGEAELWTRHRDVLLAEWVADHPGTRPAPWWRVEAPELREVRPGQHIVVGRTSYFEGGIPIVFPEGEGELVYAGELRVEGEAAYLKRLGLFLPGEEARVRRGAFADETIDFNDLDAA